jgi:IS30 family transposase
MPANHITYEERIQIETLWREGYIKNEIADRLGRHRSTVGRELERTFAHAGAIYRASVAEKQRKQIRRQANQSHRKLKEATKLAVTVETSLRKRWSPEQIAGRLRRLRRRPIICHETIYQYVYKNRKDLIPFLRQGKKRRYRRRIGTSLREKRREEAKKKRIDVRPDIVEKRSRLGDWEGDTIVGSEKTVHLVTHVDRRSGVVMIDKVDGATAQRVREATTKRFQRLPKKKRRTITYDNGVQFAEYETLERDLGLTVYFAHPYHSWERGTNENTNGLIREFFPKKSPFKDLTRSQTRFVEVSLNTRPRKRHNYATPLEVN